MTNQRISLFPLAGAVLFPGMHLPLHIFEPRYRAMVSDSLARDRLIGMIQPREGGIRPALYDVGCLGRIGEVEALADGRYNIVLQGVRRFRVLREMDVSTPFRQVEAVLYDEPDELEALPAIVRSALEIESRHFAERLGYEVDWSALDKLDDTTLVNAIGQVAPFDVASKQSLLEADSLADRAEQVMQLMQFYGRADRDGRSTLQ